MKEEVLHLIHEGHQGIEKCCLRACTSVSWCRINKDIEDLIGKCSECQRNQKSQQHEPKIHIEGNAPWKIVGTDLFQWSGKDYIIIVDYFSSYTIIRKLGSTAATSVVNSMHAVFSEYKIPDTVISDNGRQYTSEEFSDFSQRYGFSLETSCTYHQQANGKAERYVDVVKKTF